MAKIEEENRRLVGRLYLALGAGDVEAVRGILAADLEWWFHGPRQCDHLRRLLTGESSHRQFSFNPASITALGNKVFVERRENESVYWVHVWTVKDGIVTQVRELFNTSLVVREFAPRSKFNDSSLRPAACLPLWQSEAGKSKGKSMPGLVLPI